ncbi:MAG: rhodanese-like domain-containing protein [Spirochaetota bacterium]
MQLVQENDAVLVDIRPPEAYNGWRLGGEERGGHIPGARSLPEKWTAYIDWIEIVRSKGIHPDSKVVVYGYTADSVDKVAGHFMKAGYKAVYVYNDFVGVYAAGNAPLQSLPRYTMLVGADWVRTLHETGSADGYDGTDAVICHCHYRNHADYAVGHIPGAVSLDTNSLESPETWNRRSPEELAKALGEHGISAGSTVILYGRFSYPKNEDEFPGSSAGHLGAIRCAFIMLYAGVRDVRILNGGLQSWLDEGFPLETEETPKRAVEYGDPVPGRPHLVIDTPEAKEYLAASDKNLVSVRSWPEYIGKVSGYNYIEKKGRIPGSVFGNCGSDAYHMENYRNLDHTTREYHEIEALWKEAGITPDKSNAFYCGTGWRGSEAFLNAYLMGWPDVSLYDGGWFEWSSDESNPYETGEPG